MLSDDGGGSFPSRYRGHGAPRHQAWVSPLFREQGDAVNAILTLAHIDDRYAYNEAQRGTSSMPTNTPAPGWFPDQSNSEQLRWWDGQAWTDHTHPRNRPESQHADMPAPGAAVPMAQPATAKSAQRKPWYLRWWAITAAVLVALSVVGNLLPDEETPGAAATEPTPTATASPATSAETEPDVEPEPVDTDNDGVNDDEDYRPEDPKVQTQNDVDTDKDGVPDFKDDFPKDAKYSKDTDGDGVADSLDDFPKDERYSKDTDGDKVADSEDAFPSDPSRSKITLAMENALSSAQDYLDYSAFSRQGLIDQLSSEYGSGFEIADATWAVSQLKVDWKQQAVQAAKDYLDYSSFSRQGLIDQLSSPYGSQFTVEEATFAVNQIGL
jgi:hypothetical protein